MFGFVIVIGFPALIWSINKGITLPLLHITFPYLVQHITVPVSFTSRAFAWITFSIIALLIPIALIGYAALSVDKQTIFLTPAFIAAFNTLFVPSIFVLTASIGKNSQEGTCFNAAA